MSWVWADRETLLKLTLTKHLTPEVAAELHAVWVAAYTQEAVLLGARDFPPLRRSRSALLEPGESAVLAYLDAILAGAVITAQMPGKLWMHIHALVVRPNAQRRGVARALVNAVVQHNSNSTIEVSTGAANAPALALYQQFAFFEIARTHVGTERLELVTLQRSARSAPLDPMAGVA